MGGGNGENLGDFVPEIQKREKKNLRTYIYASWMWNTSLNQKED